MRLMKVMRGGACVRIRPGGTHVLYVPPVPRPSILRTPQSGFILESAARSFCMDDGIWEIDDLGANAQIIAAASSRGRNCPNRLAAKAVSAGAADRQGIDA